MVINYKATQTWTTGRRWWSGACFLESQRKMQKARSGHEWNFQYEKKSGKNKKVELTDNSFEVERGVNKFELDLKEQVYLKHLKEYRIQLETKDGKNYRFFIKYVNPDYIK